MSNDVVSDADVERIVREAKAWRESLRGRGRPRKSPFSRYVDERRREQLDAQILIAVASRLRVEAKRARLDTLSDEDSFRSAYRKAVKEAAASLGFRERRVDEAIETYIPDIGKGKLTHSRVQEIYIYARVLEPETTATGAERLKAYIAEQLSLHLELILHDQRAVGDGLREVSNEINDKINSP